MCSSIVRVKNLRIYKLLNKRLQCCFCLVMQEEAEHLATAHPSRAMEVLVQFDGISVEWEELKRTLQGCEDSLMVASRLQSFIQVHRESSYTRKKSNESHCH